MANSTISADVRGGPSGIIRRHPLPAFFGMAFAISWSLWGSLFFLAPEGWDVTAGATVLLPALLGGIGSSASGIIVTAISHGRAGLRSLFGRLRQRASPAWYAMALCPVPVMLVATLTMTGTALDADVSSKIGIGLMIGGVAAVAFFRILKSPVMKNLSLMSGALVLGVLVSLVVMAGSDPFTTTLGVGGVERLVVYPVVLWIIALGGHLTTLPANKAQS